MRVRRAWNVALAAGLMWSASGTPALAAGPAPAAVSAFGGLPRAVALPDTGPNGHWWFTAWQIPKVWALGARGQGVTVAVVDSGVQASLPEMRGVVLPGTDFHGGDGRTDHSQQVDGDNDGHGTAMAAFIAGQGGPSGRVGVAPEAKILPVAREKVPEDVTRSIRWAVDHGAKVINMSYGMTGICAASYQEAVRYALERGAVIVAAAGNQQSRSDTGFESPANCPGVIAVTALDSSLGFWAGNSYGGYVGASAPGVDLMTRNLAGQKGHASGTSAASALVSGAIALVWSKYPQLSNRQVVARALATARDLGSPGFDEKFGYGAVRPYQAIATEVPLTAANPIFDRLSAASPTASGGSGRATTDGATTATEPPGLSIDSDLVTLLVIIGVTALLLIGVPLVIWLLVFRHAASQRAQQAAVQSPVPPRPTPSHYGQGPGSG